MIINYILCINLYKYFFINIIYVLCYIITTINYIINYNNKLSYN
jgi:hypothetical protein